ncbi:hypothetical protein [Nonomuraea sp. SBT364]|uniref:hypothetical protein n=1 Tax=Nonomuraea sp. SBT364 TaxID=1580530 RepID=UPI00066AC12C|nr:hypothetical protein [Nonomuraea sp. SBT364]
MGVFPRILTISAAVVTVGGAFTAASPADAAQALPLSRIIHPAESATATALGLLGIGSGGSKGPASSPAGPRKGIRDLSVRERRAFLRALRMIGETRRETLPRGLPIMQK